MILNQTDFFARSATLDGAISDTDTQITLAGLSTRFTDAVAAGTVRYPLGPFRVSDDDGFELIAITGHVSGTTFEVERGIQGTTAEAWPDATALRAVVTREQLVPDRPAAMSRSVSSEVATIQTGFRGTYADADGYILDSGQALSIRQGTWEIVDGVLTSTSGSEETPALITVPFTGPYFACHAMWAGTPDDGNSLQGGILLNWQSNGDFAVCFTTGNSQALGMHDGTALTTEVSELIWNNGAGNRLVEISTSTSFPVWSPTSVWYNITSGPQVNSRMARMDYNPAVTDVGLVAFRAGIRFYNFQVIRIT